MSSSTGDVCCKKPAKSCTKNSDGTCTIKQTCTIKTPEGDRPCECICTCTCTSGDCTKCVCKCDCTYEKAQKITADDGTTTYRCECTCSC